MATLAQSEWRINWRDSLIDGGLVCGKINIWYGKANAYLAVAEKRPTLY
jgi:hypothetical protein